ncbi:MAG: hypothetical protein ACFB22_00980 [Rhodothalassiaceae bacterium]
MGKLLQLDSQPAWTGWTPAELAALAQLRFSLDRTGNALVWDHGWTDAGDPWVAACTKQDQELVVHVARINRRYYALDETLALAASGVALSAVTSRFLAERRPDGPRAPDMTPHFAVAAGMLDGAAPFWGGSVSDRDDAAGALSLPGLMRVAPTIWPGATITIGASATGLNRVSEQAPVKPADALAALLALAEADASAGPEVSSMRGATAPSLEGLVFAPAPGHTGALTPSPSPTPTQPRAEAPALSLVLSAAAETQTAANGQDAAGAAPSQAAPELMSMPSGTAPQALAGSGPAGSGPAGSGPAGSGPAGSGPGGSAPPTAERPAEERASGGAPPSDPDDGEAALSRPRPHPVFDPGSDAVAFADRLHDQDLGPSVPAGGVATPMPVEQPMLLGVDPDGLAADPGWA